MYFPKKGKENTDKALEIAFNMAKEREIKHIVIASTWGYTAEKSLDYLSGEDLNLVIVTHNTGFSTPGVQEFDAKIREKVEKAGGHVLTGTMPTRSLTRAIKNKLGFSETDIACASWRMFCEGTKVCVEIAGMACDAGLIPPGDTIVVAGTGRGADTVMIIDARSSQDTFLMKIREILAKPYDW